MSLRRTALLLCACAALAGCESLLPSPRQPELERLEAANRIEAENRATQAQRRAADHEGDAQDLARQQAYQAEAEARDRAAQAEMAAKKEHDEAQARAWRAEMAAQNPCVLVVPRRAHYVALYGDTLTLQRRREAWQHEHCEQVDDSPMVVRTYQRPDGVLFQREEKRDAPRLVCDGRAPADPYLVIQDQLEQARVRDADTTTARCEATEASRAERAAARAAAARPAAAAPAP